VLYFFLSEATSLELQNVLEHLAYSVMRSASCCAELSIPGLAIDRGADFADFGDGQAFVAVE